MNRKAITHTHRETLNRKTKKVYIAGKIGTDSEREMLEKIDLLCKELGFETFLPHRDVGIAQSIEDVKKIFEGDINNGLKNTDLIIAILDGLYVGAGTAWELGYAYAKGIPAIGLKTDESVEEALEQLSSILIGSMPIVKSADELREKIEKLF
ncbi:nucleoside 2-deoxyribosyltransferase [Candidatus Pacearchaeota archaeon]|nr:nucleoside 2-deoxyribosyltransferase [Candidatus Pacearchaeota archaeon]